MDYISDKASLEEFRRQRALLSWVKHTRPDVSYRVNHFAQITERTFSVLYLKKLNFAVRFHKNTPSLELMFMPLDLDSVHMHCSSDALFANSDVLSSQIVYLIVLADYFNCCRILDYQSQKSRCVVQSTKAAKTYAFLKVFDRFYPLFKDLKRTHAITMDLKMFIDSMQLFEALHRGMLSNERWLIINVLAARQSYKRFEVSSVEYIQRCDNAAYRLATLKHNVVLDESFSIGAMSRVSKR